MSSKSQTKHQYTCEQCGASFPKWGGQCGECHAWNSLVETVVARASPARYAGYAGAAEGSVQSLREVKPEAVERCPTGLTELDRVLGGGLVTGSAVLIGGDPGIGKSTLLLQMMAHLSTQRKCLYVTGEESVQQVSLRAHRLQMGEAPCLLMAEINTDVIIAEALRLQPQVMVLDSIQTLCSPALQSAPGSVAQVRECAAQLVRFAKQTGTVVFLVGHVTKEGTLAGPRVLEHMVDTVLYFEGDSTGPYRLVRAIKNRFGAVNELAAFAMSDSGLKQVANSSAIFLSRHEQPVPGSVITVVREGTRPMLVEVQALVAGTASTSPRRVTLGLDNNRLVMLLAVLHRHGGLVVYDQDVFVNVVGGLRVSETAADLPVVLAAVSSLKNRPLPSDTVAFGEIGLAGELRPVQGGQDRLREAAKQGFRRALVPLANAPKKEMEDIEVIGVRSVAEALKIES